MGLTEYGHIATEETQLRVADLLQAIAAGSAGPEYTDATFKALLDDTNTTEIFPPGGRCPQHRTTANTSACCASLPCCKPTKPTP